MWKSRVFLALVTLSCLAGTVAAQNPLHNYSMPNDVDGNQAVQPLDALIIINALQPTAVGQASPLASTSTFYVDTSNDALVSPVDLLLVFNQLNVPEPSTFVSGGVGLVLLAGYALRRRRRR